MIALLYISWCRVLYLDVLVLVLVFVCNGGEAVLGLVFSVCLQFWWSNVGVGVVVQ